MLNKKTIKSGEVDMCTGTLFPKIAAYFFPVMLSNLLQSLYSAADQAVIGQFAKNGSDALAAIGSSHALSNLILCLVTGLAVGTSSIVARFYGADNKKGVHRAVHTSIMLSVILGILIGVVGVVFARPLLLLMGTHPDVLDSAVLYMTISFAGLPVVSVYNYSSAILRAIGDTKRPMYYLMISGVINVILNIFFVTVFEMSVDGVALATVISQAFSCVLTVRNLVLTDGCYKLEFKKLRMYKSETLNILYVGIPAGLQSSVFAISNVIMQSSVNTLGKIAVSGSTAASTIEAFAYMAINSLYHTSLAFCGQNFGARKYDRIKKSLLYCIGIATAIGIMVGAIVIVFSNELLRIFLKENLEAIEFGKQRILATCIFYFLCGIMEAATGALRGINKAIPALINSVLCTCVLRVIWCFTIFKMYPSIGTLFISYPMTWALTSTLHLVMFAIYYSRMKKSSSIAG